MNSKPTNKTIINLGNNTYPANSGFDSSVFQYNTLDFMRFAIPATNTISVTERERFEIAFCPYDVTVKRPAAIYTGTFSQENNVANFSHCNQLMTTITKNSPYPFTSIAGVDGTPSNRAITVTLFLSSSEQNTELG